MSENELSHDIVERLTRIETQTEMIAGQLKMMEQKLEESSDLALIAHQSSKSAHHRINTIYIVAGAVGAAVSFVINYFTKQ